MFEKCYNPISTVLKTVIQYKIKTTYFKFISNLQYCIEPNNRVLSSVLQVCSMALGMRFNRLVRVYTYYTVYRQR